MMDKPILQHWVHDNWDDQKQNDYGNIAIFSDPEESPIKCTVCGKAGHNHRTCPNVPPG